MKNFKLIIFASLILFLSCKEKINGQEETNPIVHINSIEFKEKIDENSTQLIDVRTPEEYIDGHLKLAKNMNFHETNFMDMIGALDKEKPVYLYCRSGKRSASAAEKLKEAGFTEIYNLKGGILAWQEKQFETEN